MSKYGKSRRSNALNWYLHRITGTFLIFFLITHFWVQHYDATTASISHAVVTEEGQPTYTEEARDAVRARYGQEAEVTSYDVLMLRLGDPVYGVLWKGFNILFMMVALHHGFYGLNNVMTDYLRRPMSRLIARTLSWGIAAVLFIIGLYSVIVAGWGFTPPGG